VMFGLPWHPGPLVRLVDVSNPQFRLSSLPVIVLISGVLVCFLPTLSVGRE